MRIDKKALVIFSSILATALILRCIGLGRQSLWLDEFASWTCSPRSFWDALSCDAFQKPPVYYTLLHYWMGAFGSSEGALRALSIPPSIASVWLIYLLGAKLFSRPIGYMAAVYQAVSTFQIYFAQEARNYSWLIFFLLLAGLFLWNALEADSRRLRLRYWIAYTASITLALYTHYVALFFIAGHGLYVFFWCRKRLLPAAISVGTALILISPFFILFIRNPEATADQIRRYPVLKVLQAYFVFMFGDSLIPMDAQAVRQLTHTLAASAWIVVLILASVAIIGRFCWTAWSRWRQPMLYVLWQAVVPVAMAFLVSMRKTFFDRRYMSPASPYVYLLVAAAVWEVILTRQGRSAIPWRTMAGFAAIGAWCLLLTVSLYQYYFASRFGKEQWREAVAYVDTSSSSDRKDLLILDPDYLQKCFRYYQTKRLPIWPVTPEIEGEAVRSEGVIRGHAGGFHRVWLVYSHNSNEDLLAELRRMYPEGASREFPQANGIEIYSFEVADAE